MDIRKEIEEQAKTQGFYGSLLERLDYHADYWPHFLEQAEVNGISNSEQLDNWLSSNNYFRGIYK